MKRKLLSATIASVCLAGFSQSSMAVDVYLGGSSAQDTIILTESIENICASTTTAGGTYPGVTIYQDVESGGNNFKAWTCTVSTAQVPGLSVASESVTFHKINQGGSGAGVLPILETTQPASLNVANAIANASVSTTATLTTLANGKKVTTYTVPTTGVYAQGGTSANLTPAALDGGVADLDPLIFNGVNQPWNGVQPTTTTRSSNPINWGPSQFVQLDNATSDLLGSSGATVHTGVSIIWAVPVTLNLYEALQASQGLLNYGTGHTYSNPAASCAPGAYSSDQAFGTATSALQDGACMPSLTKAQLATIITGGISKWDSLYTNGNSVVAAATELAANAASVTGNGTTGFTYSLPTNTYINFCQRVTGSGTAASQYAYFLNAPANQTTSAGPVSQKTHAEHVFWMADGGNEEKCLDDLNQGVSAATAKDWQGYPLTAYGTATSYPSALRFASTYVGWGIGQQSTDKNNTLGKHYRFIKINGVAPTSANVYSGAYDFVNQSSWITPSSTYSNGPDQALLVQALINTEIDPYKLNLDYDAPLVQPFGLAGFIGSVSAAQTGTNPGEGSGFAVGPTINSAIPVNPWIHALGASSAIDNGGSEYLDQNQAASPLILP
jgi:ABC-type phosphate transport system substrate-binding protein